MNHLKKIFAWSTPARWGTSLLLTMATLGSWQGLLRVESALVHRQRGGEMGLVRVAEPDRQAAAAREKPSPPTEKPLPPPLGTGSHPAIQPASIPEVLPSPFPTDRSLAARELQAPREEAPSALEPHSNGSPSPGGVDGSRRGENSHGKEPGGAETPVELKALDQGFRLVAPVMPVYPLQAKRQGKGGEVRLELGIDPAGKVRQLTILEVPAGWGFGEAAREAYRAARFTPPTMRGAPVWVVWRKTLRFTP